jgi:hypothetical protein
MPWFFNTTEGIEFEFEIEGCALCEVKHLKHSDKCVLLPLVLRNIMVCF